MAGRANAFIVTHRRSGLVGRPVNPSGSGASVPLKRPIFHPSRSACNALHSQPPLGMTQMLTVTKELSQPFES